MKRGNYILLVFCIGLIVFSIYLFHLEWKNKNRALTFAVLDVGQGDAIFIESPTGTQVLIDAGSPRKVTGPLLQVMSPLDKTINAIIMTNPDSDHIGGFLDILKNYKVTYAFEPGTINDSDAFQSLKSEIKKQNIKNILAKKGMRLDLGGGVYIDILFPDRNVRTWANNDGSIIAMLSYGETSIMLTGDSSKKTEEIVLSQYSKAELDSDILKVGHHGSRTSTSANFVQAVTPAQAIISLGKGNRYGHPHPETLAVLEDFGAEILRTDLLGNIIMKCDRMGVCTIKKSRN